jgi:hypothetical protein
MFLALGFVDPTWGVGKCDLAFWTNVARLATGHYYGDPSEMMKGLGLYALILAAPAALVGWAVQAIAIVVWSLARGGTRGDSPATSIGREP